MHVATSTPRTPFAVIWALAIGTFSLALFLPSAGAQAQADELRWRFEPGNSLVYESTRQSRIVAPMMEAGYEHAVTLRLDVLELEEDDAARLRVTLESFRSALIGPWGRTEYDSETDDHEAPNDFEDLARLAESPLEMVVTPDGRIREPAPDDASRIDAWRQTFGSQLFGNLPDESVEEGTEWGHERSMDTPGGTFASEARFVVEEIRDVDGSRVAVIAFEAEGGVADPGDPETEVSRDELGGEILFDMDRGLIVRDRTEMIVEFRVEEAEQPFRVESSSELVLVEREEPPSDPGFG